MIANFFQSLGAHCVEYLLISGQATVLYGAATFSEDIDLWINATPENRAQFLSALRACRARYYKLTPPFAVEHLVRRHDFHFLLPGAAEDGVYLDVMGVPPRVGGFIAARGSARWIETEWGSLHTIGIKELVELKKTPRLEDYPVISRRVLAWFDHAACAPGTDDYRWAFENIFTLTELRSLLLEHPAAPSAWPGDAPAACAEFARQLQAGGEAAETVEQNISEWMSRRIAALQLADRRYWRDIIAELKQLRATGKLAAEGAPV